MKDNLIEFAKWWKSVYKEKLAAVYIDERYEMKTVYELFMQRFISQENKHSFPDGWAIKQVEELTRDEFLMELSDAIELRLMKHERKVQEK